MTTDNSRDSAKLADLAEQTTSPEPRDTATSVESTPSRPAAELTSPVRRAPAKPKAADWRKVAMAAFDARGPLAANLPGYEPRPGQVDMAQAIVQALDSHRHGIVEAGTGVGKSLAYLVPAVLSGQQVVVTTATRALQDQLWNKDIPFLRRSLGDFPAAIVKGISNYLCFDRLDQLNRQFDLSQSPSTREAIDLWSRSTETGEVDELVGRFPSEFISQLTIDSDGCLGAACRFFEAGCFAMLARRRARDARIIVANHSLLCSDLAIRAATDGKIGILPPATAFVVDEAHQLEDAATGAFESRLTNFGLIRFCADRVLRRYADPEILAKILDANDALFVAIARVSRQRRFILGQGLGEARTLYEQLDVLATDLTNNRESALMTSEEETARYDKLVLRAKSLSQVAETLALPQAPTGSVRFAERAEGHSRVSFVVRIAPIDVSDRLSQNLFAEHTVICTSATLATGEGPQAFDFFRARVGAPAESIAFQAASPFDYREQALLYLPSQMPDPGQGIDTAWDTAVEREIRQLLDASRGRAFLLFTSNAALQRAFTALDGQIDYPCFAQGEMPRNELLQAFKTTPGAVLFGVRSFWEGVDVPGEALSLVVIDRLPFAVPDDPVIQARVDRIKATGGNWFGEFTLPAATLQLKQGFGRLIRRRDDRGVVAILDPRLTTRSYGRLVLRCLPPAPVVRHIERVRRFFAEGSANPDE